MEIVNEEFRGSGHAREYTVKCSCGETMYGCYRHIRFFECTECSEFADMEVVLKEWEKRKPKWKPRKTDWLEDEVDI